MLEILCNFTVSSCKSIDMIWMYSTQISEQWNHPMLLKGTLDYFCISPDFLLINMNVSLNSSICALKSVSFHYSIGPVQMFPLFLVPVLADICTLDHWGKSKINWFQLLFKVLSYCRKGVFYFSLMPISLMILQIILFLFKIGVFPQPSSLDEANGIESKQDFFCVLCQEYWKTFPDQPPGSQTKYQNKLPNLHWPWKFCLVQDCVLALASEKHSFSS